MAIDLARVQALPKSRGVANLPPWNRAKEMRQRRELAFRLDFPRKRDLHKIAIARAAEVWLKPKRLTDAPPLLLSSRRYLPERIERAPGSEFHLEVKRETSLLRGGGATPEEMRMPRSPPQTKATPVHGHVGTA
jgi:hypothetical protein